MSDQSDYNVEYWTQQEQLYLKQLAEDPTKAARNHIGLAMVYEVMSRFDDCFLHCNKALELTKESSDLADAHLWMGRAHQAKKEDNTAIAHFIEALELEPEHDAAIEDIVTCYINLKDYAHAEYWLKKLEAIEGMEDTAWMGLADLFYETKDFDRALSYYEKCLSASGNDVMALCGKGRCLAEKKLYAESIELFKKAIAVYPENALPHYCIGLCYQNSDDQYRAMHHYTKALEIDPSFAEVYNNVAKLYADFDGDIKTAIEYLEKALTLVENTKLKQVIYINLVRLFKRIADAEHADFYNKKLLENLGFGDLLSDGEEDDE